MKYHIEILPKAARQIRKLPKSVQDLLFPALFALADNPRPLGCKKMAGSTDEYRIRVGNYRIVYQVQDKKLWVLVVRLGHRREVYRH